MLAVSRGHRDLSPGPCARLRVAHYDGHVRRGPLRVEKVYVVRLEARRVVESLEKPFAIVAIAAARFVCEIGACKELLRLEAKAHLLLHVPMKKTRGIRRSRDQ